MSQFLWSRTASIKIGFKEAERVCKLEMPAAFETRLKRPGYSLIIMSLNWALKEG